MRDKLSEQECATSKAKIAQLATAINGVIFGQEQLIEDLITGLLARGHVLLEGLPGLGKTELVKSLAKAIKLDVKRIQFTPDLLPGDITGSPLLQEVHGQQEFVFRPGPLFANIVLADEINRASPKTQSALLEAMQERRVTVMGQTHNLPDPFFVLATQNPIELEGTYPLPEAQLDRFLLKLEVTHRSREVLETIIRKREMGVDPHIDTVMSREELIHLMGMSSRVAVPDAVVTYIARLVERTHPESSSEKTGIRFGASPRAALGLAAAARARALSKGRDHASFEDVKHVAPAILRHRIILDYSSKLQGRTSDTVVEEILEALPFIDRDVAPTMHTSISP